MAKIIAFADPYVADQMLWVNPDAVEQVRKQADNQSIIYFRSGSQAIIVGGEPDFVVAKLNEASR